MGLIETLSGLIQRSPAPATSPAPASLDAVLACIETLAAGGRRFEAIAYASAEAARIDEVALWARLERLREEAVGDAVAHTAPRPVWPPELPDPFPNAAGIPEIDASALTWQLLGGAILHHGSLLVRGLIDPATAERLRRSIDEALDSYDAFQSGPQAGQASSAYLPYPVPETEPLEATRPWSRESGGVWAVESPRAFEAILALYQARGVIDAIGGYLGERPLLSIGKTVLRRAEPSGMGVFHQDGAFMDAKVRTVNVWTALSACGEDAPGLEVVARRLPYIVETGTGGSVLDWAVGRPAAERATGGADIVFPVFGVGDALIFDQLMLHATGVKPGMSKRRYAIESWFFAPSAYAADQIPLAI